MRNKENRRKGRWRDINFHAREIRGKMKENEEKGDINNKNTLENRLTSSPTF